MPKKTAGSMPKNRVVGETFASADDAIKAARKAGRAGKTLAVYEIRDLPVSANPAKAVTGGRGTSCWIALRPSGE